MSRAVQPAARLDPATAARTVALVLLLAPRNAGIAVLKLYRAVASPLYGDVCRYHPSCSRYALEAMQQTGLVVGAALAAARVVRCNPWSRGGVDDPPARLDPGLTITPRGFVAPAAGRN